MKKLKHIFLGLFCIYLAAVVLLCVISTQNIPELPKSVLGIPMDKMTHFVMFLPFPILGYMAFRPDCKGIWRNFAVLGILCMIGLGFAFSTERLQSMTAYRSYELADMAADSAGIIAGSLMVTVQILRQYR